MKLLTKTAEHRYPTAPGIDHDSPALAGTVDSQAELATCRLANATHRTGFLICEKLYGREREVETPLALFDRTVG